MDKKQIPELTKITFDTSQANDMQAALEHVAQDMNTFSRVVASATNSMEYWQSNMKKIVTEPGTNQGYFQQSVYVNKADAANVLAALQASNARQFGGENKHPKHGWQYDIQAHDAAIVQGNINKLVGTEALKMAQAEAKALGGDVWRSPTKKFPDRVTYFYPADNAEEIMHSGSKKTAPFKGAKSISTEEQKRLDEIEAARLEKEHQQESEREAARITKEEEAHRKARQRERDKAAKIKADQDKAQEQAALQKEKDASQEAKNIVSENKKQQVARNKERTAFERLIASQEKQRERLEKEEAKKIEAQNKKQEREELQLQRQEEREELKKEQEKNKAKAEDARAVSANVKSLVGLLTITVSLLRRLVVSSLQAATNLQKDAVAAHNLGMNYRDVREFTLFDKAHGLPEGTSLGAMQYLQTNFGDVTNLNEGAIATLARVMGSDVVELIRSGLGGENPKALLEMILDKYFKQFKEGKNSLGMDVGQDEARRELITSLSTISSDLAMLFAQMTEDASSFNLGGFDNFEGWKKSVDLFGGKLDEANEIYTKEIAEKYNKVIASFDNLQNNFLAKLSQSLDGILSFIANLRIGLSESEKYELDIKNREKNEKTSRALEVGMAGNEELAKQAIKQIYEGKRFKSIPFKNELPANQDTFSLLMLLNYISGGKSSIKKYFGGEDVSGWTERADALLGLLGAGEAGNLGFSFLAYALEFETMKKLEEEGKKRPGEGIDIISYDPAMEAVKIGEQQKLFADLYNVPEHWETLTAGVQARIPSLITSNINELLTNDPEGSDAMFNAIMSDYTRDKNSLAYKVLNNKNFEGRLSGITRNQTLNESLNNPSKISALHKLIYDYVREHPELAYEYGLSAKERESMVGMAIDRLPNEGLNNLGLGWIAANYLPSEIDTSLPYNMNWQSGFDKDGNATITINFEQEGKVFGSATVKNPAFASSSQSGGKLIFNNEQIIFKHNQQ